MLKMLKEWLHDTYARLLDAQEHLRYVLRFLSFSF